MINKKELKKELETQDNVSTSHPFFVVYEGIKYTADRDYDNDGYSWHYNGDWSSQTDEELLEELREEYEGNFDKDFKEHLLENDSFEWEGCDYNKWYYQIIPRYNQGFFTRKSAEAYIEQNKHRLTAPTIFVEHMYRNYEMQDIRNYFLEKDNG